jgi:hypothetical protein
LIYYMTNTLSLSGQYFRNFVGSIRAQETKKQYVYSLKRFMLYTKEADIDKLASNREPKLTEAGIIDWFVNLREEEEEEK